MSNISTLDIAWAAGFMEGEGSFGHYGCPAISVAQVQKEPIDRMVRIFGGKISRRNTNGFSDKPIWVWRPDARVAIQVMMTLYCLMSPKRQTEIKSVLDKWKAAPRLLKAPGHNICTRGHTIDGDNAQYVKGHRYPRCRACCNDSKRKRRAKAHLTPV